MFIIIIYCNFGLREKICSSVEVTISTERFNRNWESHCTLTTSCWKIVSFSPSKLLCAQIKSLHVFIVVTCPFLSNLEGNFKSWRFTVTAHAYGLTLGCSELTTYGISFFFSTPGPGQLLLLRVPSHSVKGEGSSDQVNCHITLIS